MKTRSYMLIFMVVMLLWNCSSKSDESSASAAESNTNQVTDSERPTYPDIQSFQTAPSDQFIVDLPGVIDGHMYKGKDSPAPHSGAHVIFDASGYPTQNITDYPKIYAVADGTITRVTSYYKVSPMGMPPHYRYGLDLTFAQSGDQTLAMHYSIEPFVDPQNEQFYHDYIMVEEGDAVKKGDVIAYMYLADNANAHIHYNIYRQFTDGRSEFVAPAIFNQTIMDDYLARIHFDAGGTRNYDTSKVQGGQWMGKCMGYKITAEENPFQARAADCLE